MEADATTPDQVLGIGKLIDLKWKVGVAMSSDACRSLNSPYVTMTIKVAKPSSDVTEHTFEMNVMQFQNFTRQLKEMASMLETV